MFQNTIKGDIYLVPPKMDTNLSIKFEKHLFHKIIDPPIKSQGSIIYKINKKD